jgi:2-keto-4-pentenoate hydratase/2-oxohepta-3-ene-1,7-dioic acid hydratase in catechol pathway
VRKDTFGAVAAALKTAPEVNEADLVFRIPFPKPDKTICVGLNYREHTEEVGYEQPDYPTLFTRFASSFVAHGENIEKPTVSDQLDFEGEMVAVIGKTGRNVSAEDALSLVAGYTLFNDVSVRDYQFKTPQWTVGKNFDGTGPIGPWFVTADDMPAGGAGLMLETRLNGEVVQSANTSDMIFDVQKLIVILSEAFTLSPGDLIVSGTPSGIGFSRNPKLFMQTGDIVEVSLDRIGVLRNKIAFA